MKILKGDHNHTDFPESKIIVYHFYHTDSHVIFISVCPDCQSRVLHCAVSLLPRRAGLGVEVEVATGCLGGAGLLRGAGLRPDGPVKRVVLTVLEHTTQLIATSGGLKITIPTPMSNGTSNFLCKGKSIKWYLSLISRIDSDRTLSTLMSQTTVLI